MRYSIRLVCHLTSNEIVTVDRNTARLQCYIVVLTGAEAKATVIGDYDLQLVKQDGRWLIKTLFFNSAI